MAQVTAIRGDTQGESGTCTRVTYAPATHMGGSGVWEVDLIARGHVEGSNNFGYGFSKTYM